jgi:hypothetical protein
MIKCENNCAKTGTQPHSQLEHLYLRDKFRNSVGSDCKHASEADYMKQIIEFTSWVNTVWILWAWSFLLDPAVVTFAPLMRCFCYKILVTLPTSSYWGDWVDGRATISFICVRSTIYENKMKHAHRTIEGSCWASLTVRQVRNDERYS